jgi:hypothetical protein
MRAFNSIGYKLKILTAALTETKYESSNAPIVFGHTTLAKLGRRAFSLSRRQRWSFNYEYSEPERTSFLGGLLLLLDCFYCDRTEFRGSLSGKISDPNGAVVPGSKVEIKT